MVPSLLFMRDCEPGRHSFAYFSVAADRKVSRHKGETTSEKNNSLIRLNKNNIHPNNPSFSTLDNPLISHSRFPATDREATHS